MVEFVSNYSVLDRFLHRLAFNAPVQEILSDIEAKLYQSQWKDIKVDRPVFVSGLPRAGTTILFESLARSKVLASSTYREMPFVTAPVLWRKFSGSFQKTSKQRDRAHGDGLRINEDSPEGFEEVLWLKHWPKHYSDNAIKLWAGDEFSQPFANLLYQRAKQVLYINQEHKEESLRWLVKSNASIARLPLLAKIFPDSQIIVPFRDPQHHANSLLRQHQRFSSMCENDPFARRYVDDLGHFDFGPNFKFIEFPGLVHGETKNLDSLQFWLDYWKSAYAYLIDNLPSNAVLFDYDKACSNPALATENIGQYLGIAGDIGFKLDFEQRTLPKNTGDSDIDQLWQRLKDSDKNII